jgi:hypothetical protein
MHDFVANQASQFPSADHFINLVMDEFLGSWDTDLPVAMHIPIRKCIRTLYLNEAYCVPPPPFRSNIIGTLEGAKYRDNLLALHYRMGVPSSTTNVVQAIITLFIKRFCDMLPPTCLFELCWKAPKFAPLITRVQNLPAFISSVLNFLHDEKLRTTTHILPRLRAQLDANVEALTKKSRTVTPHDFSGTPQELLNAYLQNTPFIELFDISVPIFIPPKLLAYQSQEPRDPEHPKHKCYQCRRLLLPDFAEEPWQELIYPSGPFFHTSHCKTTALNRHLSDGGTRDEAYERLVREYQSVVQQYEESKRSKEAEELTKEQIRLEREREAREERERREADRERRHQEMLAQREADRLQREQKDRLKEEQKEVERLAAEEAAEHEHAANLAVYHRLDDTTRCEHTQIVAGSGAGKTTLIEYDILKLLARPNPPGIVVIDPKGLLIQRLQKLAVFDPDNGRLRDRLVIVDPAHSPALNMFDTSGFRVNENQTIDIFQYMFASKMNPRTPKQGGMFAYLTRLLFTIPDATIHTLLDLCDDKSTSLDVSPFRAYIEKLDTTSLRFFRNEYFGERSEYASTRKEVKQRLFAMLHYHEIDTAFSAPKRRVDMFEAIQNRRIVLVNADYDTLSEEGCQLWGRTIIGLTLNAAFARSKLPESDWHECFVYVDEAQLFVEETKTPRFLQLAREYRVGITHAHQDISACLTSKLATSLAGNTAIKYAARIAGDDLLTVARNLNCDSEFLIAQRKDSQHAKFACYIAGMTAPISVSIPWQPLKNQPQMSAGAYQRLLEENKKRVRLLPETQKAPVEGGLRETKRAAPAEADQPIVPSPNPVNTPDDDEPKGTWG